MTEETYEERAGAVAKKRVTILVWFLVLIGLEVLLLWQHFSGEGIEGVWAVSGGILFASLLPIPIMWRCPDCRYFLGFNPLPKRCPSCFRRFSPDAPVEEVRNPETGEPEREVKEKRERGAGPKAPASKKKKKKKGRKKKKKK